MLECDVEGGVGLLFGSKKHMTCIFKRTDGTVENYKGRVTKIGIDIGVTADSHIMWAVLAPSNASDKGGLAGHYDGVGAEVTVAGGVGEISWSARAMALRFSRSVFRVRKGLTSPVGLNRSSWSLSSRVAGPM